MNKLSVISDNSYNGHSDITDEFVRSRGVRYIRGLLYLELYVPICWSSLGHCLSTSSKHAYYHLLWNVSSIPLFLMIANIDRIGLTFKTVPLISFSDQSGNQQTLKSRGNQEEIEIRGNAIKGRRNFWTEMSFIISFCDQREPTAFHPNKKPPICNGYVPGHTIDRPFSFSPAAVA